MSTGNEADVKKYIEAQWAEFCGTIGSRDTLKGVCAAFAQRVSGELASRALHAESVLRRAGFEKSADGATWKPPVNADADAARCFAAGHRVQDMEHRSAKEQAVMLCWGGVMPENAAWPGDADRAAEMIRAEGEQLRIRAVDAEKKVEELKKWEPRLLTESTPLDVKIRVAHEIMRNMVEAFDALNGDGNYSETTAKCGDKAYYVTVRRGDKPTDHQLRKEAESRVRELEEAVDVLAHEIWCRARFAHAKHCQEEASLNGCADKLADAIKRRDANPMARDAVKRGMGPPASAPETENRGTPSE